LGVLTDHECAKVDLAKAEARRIEALERENARLRHKLGHAEQIIAAQKKLCELLGLPTDGGAPQ
jgi:transposase